MSKSTDFIQGYYATLLPTLKAARVDLVELKEVTDMIVDRAKIVAGSQHDVDSIVGVGSNNLVTQALTELKQAWEADDPDLAWAKVLLVADVCSLVMLIHYRQVLESNAGRRAAEAKNRRYAEDLAYIKEKFKRGKFKSTRDAALKIKAIMFNDPDYEPAIVESNAFDWIYRKLLDHAKSKK